MPAVNVMDMRRRARRRLPRALFDYLDGGAMDERTLAANSDDFADLRFLPKALVDMSVRTQSVTVLGQELRTPIILSPTGLTGFFGPGGGLAAARAAKAAGAGYCLSTMGTETPEEIASVHPGFWMQLYVERDRGRSKALVERAAAAGARVVCLTVDTIVSGKRERDLRNGFGVPPRLTVLNALDFAMRPQWVWSYVTGPKVTFANFSDLQQGESGFTSIARQIVEQLDQALTWKDVDWLKSIFPGKVAIKGILHPEDARRAVEHGADAIIASNHGGRQLDGATSPIRALPAILDTVGDRCEVIVDGGIRRGTDVVKALALGARACMMGRPFLYGLAAGGEAGVGEVLGILKDEIDNAQALAGCPDLRHIDPSFIETPARGWPANR